MVSMSTTEETVQRKTKPILLSAVALVAGTIGMAVGVGVAPSGVAWGACTGVGTVFGVPGTSGANTLALPTVASAVGAPAMWATGINGAGVDVAVIDTGVNAVPGLASPGKVVDAVDLSFDAPTSAVRYRDLHGHGTNMSGIIAGDGSGGDMTVGVAPKARIVNVKVGAGDGSVDASQVIAALDWVVQNRNTGGRNIRVVNLSYDTDATTDYKTDPLAMAVENAWKAGLVVVVSGGNDGKSNPGLGNPARDPFVIAVGGSSFDASTLNFKVQNWSSTGDGVRNPDFVAPGDQIASLRVPGSFLDTGFPAARVYDPAFCTSLFRGSGTSQAAAVVSGSAALLLQARPTLTPDQVKGLLKSTAYSVKNVPIKEGAGMINVFAASKAPAPTAIQSFASSTGTGSLEAARGTLHVGASATDYLKGEYHAYLGAFSSPAWAASSKGKTAWSNQTYDAAGRLATGAWAGSSWSGSSWSGSSWSGSSWSGSSWSGSSWSGSSWSGSSWSGSSWSGSSWSGSSWSGSSWSGTGWK
jgi:serine protease AprX